MPGEQSAEQAISSVLSQMLEGILSENEALSRLVDGALYKKGTFYIFTIRDVSETELQEIGAPQEWDGIPIVYKFNFEI